ncbi:MAG: glycerophosphodiester phosphodiesterase, partial [Candidatus Heimdallarchaeota archaeon]|nr:glycerophosphodiester phosphodiesterase [Candidatus Heimdallarchaeota archaeon]
SLELAEGINIPSLEEVLETFGNKTLLNIEFKSKEDSIEELVTLVHKYKLKKDPRNLIISSFNSNPLRKIKSIDPEIPTGLLVHFSRNQVKRASGINCDAIHPMMELPDGWSKILKRLARFLQIHYINKCFSEARKENMMLVNPYDVNHEFFLRKSFENDLHAVITDEVEKAWRIRKEFI